MPKLVQALRLCVVALLCLGMGACFDVEETWWIEADGSGRFETALLSDVKEDEDPQVVMREARDILSFDEEDLAELSEAGLEFLGQDAILVRGDEGPQVRTSMQLKFKRLSDVAAMMKRSGQLPSEALEHVPRFREIEGGLREFRYQPLGEPLNVTVHFPGRIATSNATNTLDDERIGVWDAPKGETLIATVRVDAAETSPLLYGGIAGGALVLGVAAWFALRRRGGPQPPTRSRAARASRPASSAAGSVANDALSALAFVSHASEDAAVAQGICAEIEDLGAPCWIAPRDILPGAEYGAAILRAIKSCPVFLLVLTDEANDSRHVRNEVERAVNAGAVLIVCRVGEVTPGEGLELFLASSHWFSVVPGREEEAAAPIEAAIRAHAKARRTRE